MFGLYPTTAINGTGIASLIRRNPNLICYPPTTGAFEYMIGQIYNLLKYQELSHGVFDDGFEIADLSSVNIFRIIDSTYDKNILWIPNIRQPEQLISILNSRKYSASHIDYSMNVPHFIQFSKRQLFREYLIRACVQNARRNIEIFTSQQPVDRYTEGLAISQMVNDEELKMLKYLSNFPIPLNFRPMIDNLEHACSVNILQKLFKDMNAIEYSGIYDDNDTIYVQDIVSETYDKLKSSRVLWPKVRHIEFIKSTPMMDIVTPAKSYVTWGALPIGEEFDWKSFTLQPVDDYTVKIHHNANYTPVGNEYNFKGHCIEYPTLKEFSIGTDAAKARAKVCYENYVMMPNNIHNYHLYTKHQSPFNAYSKNDVVKFLKGNNFNITLDTSLHYNAAIWLGNNFVQSSVNNTIIIPEMGTIKNIMGLDYDTNFELAVNKVLLKNVNSSSVKIICCVGMALGQLGFKSLREWYLQGVMSPESLKHQKSVSLLLAGEIGDHNITILNNLYNQSGPRNLIINSFGAEGSAMTMRGYSDSINLTNTDFDIVLSDISFTSERGKFEEMVSDLRSIITPLATRTNNILIFKINHPSMYLLNTLIKEVISTRAAGFGTDGASVRLLKLKGQNSMTFECYIMFKFGRREDIRFFDTDKSSIISHYERMLFDPPDDFGSIHFKLVNDFTFGVTDVGINAGTGTSYTAGEISSVDAPQFLSLALRYGSRVRTFARANGITDTVVFVFKHQTSRFGMANRVEDYYLERPEGELRTANAFGTWNRGVNLNLVSSVPGYTIVTMGYRHQIANLVKEAYPLATYPNIPVRIVGVRGGDEIAEFEKNRQISVFEIANVEMFTKYGISVKNAWAWTLETPLDPGAYIFNFVVMSYVDDNDTKGEQLARLKNLILRVSKSKNVSVYVTIYYNPVTQSLYKPEEKVDYSWLDSMPDAISYVNIGKDLNLSFGSYDPVHAFTYEELQAIPIPTDVKFSIVPFDYRSLYTIGARDAIIPHFPHAPETVTASCVSRLVVIGSVS
uniref:Uncharacterized protein n=1 Tax=Hubei reo-like virus 6 TaxID=1923181 RepID=A0A1L3KP81_9VIRU|nr:hypothetical protein 2 [Hubei reo-like virus 6]